MFHPGAVHSVDGPILNADTALVQGSSGGVIVDGEGMAVTIYVSAITSVDIAVYSAKTIAIDVAENLMSRKEGRVIAFTPRLLDYFL